MKYQRMSRKEFRQYLKGRHITVRELLDLLKFDSISYGMTFTLTQLQNFLHYRSTDKFTESDIERCIRHVYKIELRKPVNTRLNSLGVRVETVEKPDTFTYMICASCGRRYDNVPISPVRLINVVSSTGSIEQEICSRCATSELYKYKPRILIDEEAYTWRRNFRGHGYDLSHAERTL